ncbi:putative tricarboxylic transport membrane protein [Dongia mobilis]|uniref:Putative tricarboxylic transport membrane protein n=1 Tax=Dongia mobilis TaxID=578943 RepID=A0A4R6WX93_9PROT|nr:tripartite tricarboxylate transporter TctB family protein [Dongia mobilis]TDQ86424.1 putative tricarboxylic transport membrane protein [Dongia mobilis]
MSIVKRPRWQDLAVGLVLLAIGAGLVVGTFGVSTLPGQDSMGPRLFPVLIGGGLVVLGLMHLLAARTGGGGNRPTIVDGVESDLPPGHLPTLLWVVGGVALAAILFRPLGFIPAAIAVYVLTARGFAGAFSWRHVAAGIGLAVIVYVGFTAGLGLRLPAGSLLTDLL